MRSTGGSEKIRRPGSLSALQLIYHRAYHCNHSLRSSIALYEETAALRGVDIPDSEYMLEGFPRLSSGSDSTASSPSLEPLGASEGSGGPEEGAGVCEFVWFDEDAILDVPEGEWSKQDPRGHSRTPHAPQEATGGRHRGPHRPKRRGGQKHKKAKEIAPQFGKTRRASLHLRAQESAELHQSRGLSLGTHGSRTSTGWSGAAPPLRSRELIEAAWKERRLAPVLDGFWRIHCDPKAKGPALLLDRDSRLFAVRTSPAKFLLDGASELCQGIHELLNPVLSSQKNRASQAGAARGAHYPCILGHQRQYQRDVRMTEFHSANIVAVRKFLALPVLRDLCRWVSQLVSMYFPGIYARYRRCIDWHSANSGVDAEFDAFFCFCINGIFEGQDRVHCQPHADWKNVVGVCVVVVYKIPGSQFDDTQYTWLVIWEAGVIIQLPPWVALLYPSSLFYHFNIDLADLRVVTTSTPSPPTPESSTDITNKWCAGRGSMVFFNQASMFQASETGAGSIAEAKLHGHSGKTDFNRAVQEGFPLFAPSPQALSQETL